MPLTPKCTLFPYTTLFRSVNGVLDKTAGETSASIPNYASDLAFGKLVGNPTSYFAGSLGEVRIYNRALSAAEVSDLYTATTAVLLQNYATLPLSTRTTCIYPL